MEKIVYDVMTPYKEIIESIVINVGEGTQDVNAGAMGGGGATPHRMRISIAFVDFQFRKGLSTSEAMKALATEAQKVPGLSVRTDKDAAGPPVGKPINIEIIGDSYNVLLEQAERMKAFIASKQIDGLDGLQVDAEIGKPELLVNIDRDKARQFGLSTVMVATTLRTALFGKEVSKYKEKDEDYPIQLRLDEKYRNDLSTLMNQNITFRNNQGRYQKIPISAVADLEYNTTFGAVKRKNLDRMVAVNSNILEGYNANEIVEKLKGSLQSFELPDGYSYKFTGEQEEQAKSLAFLSNALLIAVSAIFLILVSQFNSLVKPFIIMASVIFSTIGVFLGLAIFNMNFVIIMTGVGVISLAGVVVNNAIVLIDYTDLVRERRKRELGLSEEERLQKVELIECLIEGGYTRLRPVLLTAITTVLGLIPLAIGLNIDFFGLLARFEPDIFMGGDNAIFWGPMAWTVIYGLVFATFLTLVIVPAMYLIADNITQLFTPKKVVTTVAERED